MENRDYQLVDLNDEQFEQYLALIKRMYERMQSENSWPWVEEARACRWSPDTKLELL